MEGQTINAKAPQKRSWLWILLIIVILALAGVLIWNYYGNNAKPTATASPSAESSLGSDLSSVDTNLNKLDDNFNQLDKIDSSEDNAPSL